MNQYNQTKGFTKIFHDLLDYLNQNVKSPNAKMVYISLYSQYNVKLQKPIHLTLDKIMEISNMDRRSVQKYLAKLHADDYLLTRTKIGKKIFYDFPIIKDLQNGNDSEMLRNMRTKKRKNADNNIRNTRTNNSLKMMDSSQISQESKVSQILGNGFENQNIQNRGRTIDKIADEQMQERGRKHTKSRTNKSGIYNPEADSDFLRTKNYLKELDQERVPARGKPIIKDIDIDYEAELQKRANDPNRIKQRGERFIVLPPPKREYNPLVDIGAI